MIRLRYLLLKASALLQGEGELPGSASPLDLRGLQLQLQLVHFALQLGGQLLPQREVRGQQEDLGVEALELLFQESRLVPAAVQLSLKQLWFCGDGFIERYWLGMLVVQLQC